MKEELKMMFELCQEWKLAVVRGVYISFRIARMCAPTCGQTGCANSFERGKTDSDVLSFVAVFQAGPLGVSRSRDARLWARPRSGLSGPLPAWHVERPRKSPKWLLAFVTAISCCWGEISRPRVYACACTIVARKIVWTVPHLAKTARRNVYARVSSFYGLILCCRLVRVTAKNHPYCLYARHLRATYLFNSVLRVSFECEICNIVLCFFTPRNKNGIYVL